MARYFRKTVLPHKRWSGDLIDFDNGHSADGQVINAGVYVLNALANDPDGIAYANFLYAGPEVKAVALSSAYWGLRLTFGSSHVRMLSAATIL